ncbi:hypothetical protein B4N89_46220 [Embleya scabrispora]|uniref:Uncharacterized protein n=1 Tax=Embleya scabrispora TaxID=159449 RepID=A0A1T3NJS1_9ACTN|nr:hypothetical protein B4N89_46220 [Embleya scabrispora]
MRPERACPRSPHTRGPGGWGTSAGPGGSARAAPWGPWRRWGRSWRRPRPGAAPSATCCPRRMRRRRSPCAFRCPGTRSDGARDLRQSSIGGGSCPR